MHNSPPGELCILSSSTSGPLTTGRWSPLGGAPLEWGGNGGECGMGRGGGRGGRGAPSARGPIRAPSALPSPVPILARRVVRAGPGRLVLLGLDALSSANHHPGMASRVRYHIPRGSQRPPPWGAPVARPDLDRSSPGTFCAGLWLLAARSFSVLLRRIRKTPL